MSRLHLKYGLVAEHDRLSTSADTLSVTQPRTGSKSRTKGDLYLIVSSSTVGGRARDATAMVAETVRREYYYDESAGIPIILEKSLRAAEKRLHGRDGHGIPPGSIGVALAVIRGPELYVATTGPAEAYLVRAARLLMPEHDPGPGLPTDEGLRLDVWRGEFAIGDSLLLVSRDLTEVVGTEELKNAVVTLHPQSAVEHLHHLFVAAGGEGSDAVLAIEATEASERRRADRLVPVPEQEGPMLEPGAPVPVLAAGPSRASVTDAASNARDAFGDAIGNVADRISDLIPGRRSQYRRITPRVSQRESQRRAAIALLGFLGVVLILGVLLWVFPRGTEQPPDDIGAGENAFARAVSLVDQVEEQRLVAEDRDRAMQLLRDAWRELARAEDTGASEAEVAPVRTRITAGLDQLYGTHLMAATVVARIGDPGTPHDPLDLVVGPDGAAYVVDDQETTGQVLRIDPETGQRVAVVNPGDGGGQGIGTPRLLASEGPDLLIVDNRGDLWRWRPSDESGSGTLGQMSVAGDAWGSDIIDIGTFRVGDPDEYKIYVVDPSAQQIHSYGILGDRSGFSDPTDYLANATDVSGYRQIEVDGHLFALTAENAVRYLTGRVEAWELDPPPDDADVRPGHEFGLFDLTGPQGSGTVYVWDSRWERIIVYDKATATFQEQWLVAPGGPTLADVRGFYVVEPADPAPQPSGAPTVAPEPSVPAGPRPVVYWLTADALVRSELVPVGPTPGASPSPGGTVDPIPTGEVSPSVSAPPTCRPDSDPPRPRGCRPAESP